MAFCTECGKQLSDSAVFCPNCGHKRFSPEEGRENLGASPAAGPAAAEADVSYKAEDLGYRPHEQIKRTNNSGAAIIVIVTAVVLLAIAVVLIVTFSKNHGYVGYWESEEVNTGAGYDDELFGHDVEGMFGLQLNEDGTFEFLSAFKEEIITGSWSEERRGVRLQNDENSMLLPYKGGNLLLEQNGYIFSLERSRRSIDDPTVKAGVYAGSSGLAGGAESDPSPLPAAPSNSPGISGSGYVSDGDFYVSVVGAEEFRDTENDTAIRIYYEYTNNFEFSENAYNTLDWEATQDGASLETAYCWEDVDAYYNDMINVRPGLTVQCCVQFKYNANGGAVEVSFFGWNSGKSGGTVVASYVPGELPGAPAPYVYEPVPDPDWTTSLDSEGYLDNGKCYVEVTDAELTRDTYGYDAVRIYYKFTNYYDDYASFYYSTLPVAYQDGIGLLETYAEISETTDELAGESVAPGRTVVVSCVFRLRNDTSAVEAEVEGSETYTAVGQTYKLS